MSSYFNSLDYCYPLNLNQKQELQLYSDFLNPFTVTKLRPDFQKWVYSHGLLYRVQLCKLSTLRMTLVQM